MQLDLLPPATKHEQHRADLKARIAKHTRRVFRRSGKKTEEAGQLRLNLIHRVGPITGKLADLIDFVYRGVRYQILKSIDNPMAPLMAIQEVLGFEVSFHKICFTGTYHVSV